MKLLNTAAGNTKIMKSQKGTDYRIASLSLYPNDTVCPAAILAGCKAPCLVSAGRGAMSNVAAGRQRKTDLWMNHREEFLEQLKKEIISFRNLCFRQNKLPAFRLNTISDIAWEKHGIPQMFPECLFYDYTKVASRLDRTPDNYKLIFSYSGRNQYQNQVRRALQTSAPIAVVFRDRIPVGGQWLGREVINGDLSDLTNVLSGDKKIIGLKLKGGKAIQSMESPFIIDPAIAESSLIAADATFSMAAE
jgi:hypothetical protein